MTLLSAIQDKGTFFLAEQIWNTFASPVIANIRIAFEQIQYI